MEAFLILAYCQAADYQRMTEEEEHHMDPQGSDEMVLEGEAPLLLLLVHGPRRNHLNPARYPDMGLNRRLLPVIMLQWL